MWPQARTPSSQLYTHPLAFLHAAGHGRSPLLPHTCRWMWPPAQTPSLPPLRGAAGGGAAAGVAGAWSKVAGRVFGSSSAACRDAQGCLGIGTWIEALLCNQGWQRARTVCTPCTACTAQHLAYISSPLGWQGRARRARSRWPRHTRRLCCGRRRRGGAGLGSGQEEAAGQEGQGGWACGEECSSKGVRKGNLL